MPEQEIISLAGASSAAVEKATGKNWQEWIRFLDEKDAAELSHKEIAVLLSKYIDSSWWCQKITVGYEHYKDRRTLGETADGGFQIGVSKTIDLPAHQVWELLVSHKGMEAWLGRVLDLRDSDSKNYSTADGIKGKINVLKPYSHIRMIWHPENWAERSILQLRITAKGQKTTLTFHQEGLPSSSERDKMQAHWINVIDKLLRLIK